MKKIKWVSKPKINSHGRRAVQIWYEDGSTKTTTYARYLMEQKVGRELESWEEADHINDDPLDDRIENLQILTKLENIKKYNEKNRAILYIDYSCDCCGVSFSLLKSEAYKRKSNNTENRLFCSRPCASKLHPRKPPNTINLICSICQQTFTKLKSYVNGKQVRFNGNWVPVCSKGCATQYSWNNRKRIQQL